MNELERLTRLEVKLEGIEATLAQLSHKLDSIDDKLDDVTRTCPEHGRRLVALEDAQKRAQDALQAADNGQTKGMHWAIKYPALTGIVSAVLYGVYEFIMRVKDFAGK